jgi:hypothetical protein
VKSAKAKGYEARQKAKMAGMSGKSRSRETLFEKTKPISRALAGNPKHLEPMRLTL